MKVYTKNTKISMSVQGDGSELFDYSLPQPHSYTRKDKNKYIISFIIKGVFTTQKGYEYINDILARFALTLPLNHMWIDYVKTPLNEAYELSQFQGLRSIRKIKDYTKVTSGKDNTFWAIKLYTEALIKENGEGNLIAYSLISAYAHNIFKTVERSTLRAKVRSIWNWYDERGWTIPKRERKLTDEELKMSRQEAAKRAHTKLALDTKKKVQKAIAGLEFMQEKINIANVARDAKVSRDTAKKYLTELGYRKKTI